MLSPAKVTVQLRQMREAVGLLQEDVEFLEVIAKRPATPRHREIIRRHAREIREEVTAAAVSYASVVEGLSEDVAKNSSVVTIRAALEEMLVKLDYIESIEP